MGWDDPDADPMADLMKVAASWRDQYEHPPPAPPLFLTVAEYEAALELAPHGDPDAIEAQARALGFGGVEVMRSGR
ncbi:MAG TPA: hypothetical protein VMW08_00325 [Acidimicrobiales bacterium]|nr:hypothetical protein [Acidimicrobiales bacterium]